MSEIENLHIKELKIDNYKSLKHSSIELQSGLNIIIGKNGAGKSNLLQFILVYATRPLDIVIPKFSNLFPSNFFISFNYESNKIGNEVSYSIEKNKNNESHLNQEEGSLYEIIFNKVENDRPVIVDEKFIGTTKVFRSIFINQIELKGFELKILRQFQRRYVKYNIPLDTPWISKPTRLTINEDNYVDFEDFINEFTFFQNLQSELEFNFLKEKKNISELKENYTLLKDELLLFLNDFIVKSGLTKTLSENTPIKELKISSNINLFKKDGTIIFENIFLEFFVENNWLPWSYLSDGTKRLFYLISECLSAGKNSIIVIEEPELGIHPHQFYKVLDFLQEQAQTKQVIISTHSPMALDILKPNELDRITIAKYDKGTKFLKLDEAQKEKAKRYMEEVGELSYYWLHSDLEND